MIFHVGDRVTLTGTIYSGHVASVFDGAYGRQVRIAYDNGVNGIWMDANEFTPESAQ